MFDNACHRMFFNYYNYYLKLQHSKHLLRLGSVYFFRLVLVQQRMLEYTPVKHYFYFQHLSVRLPQHGKLLYVRFK